MTMFTYGKFTVSMISAARVVERVLRKGDPTLVAQLLPEMLRSAQDVQGRRGR